MICGEAGHKKGSQLPGLLIQHPQIKTGTGKPVMAARGRGWFLLHFSAFSLVLSTTSGRSALLSVRFSSPGFPQAGNKAFLLVPAFFTKCINCF